MKLLLTIVIIFVTSAASFFAGSRWNQAEIVVPSSSPIPLPTPFAKYSVEGLSKADIKPGKFTIVETLEENDEFNAYKFEFEFDPEINGGTSKVTTGQINVPNNGGSYPLVLMIRGYVDRTL